MLTMKVLVGCCSFFAISAAGCGDTVQVLPAESPGFTTQRGIQTEREKTLPPRICEFLSTHAVVTPIADRSYKAEVLFQLLVPTYVELFVRDTPLVSWQKIGFTPGGPSGVESYRFVYAPLKDGQTYFYKFVAYDITTFPLRECDVSEGSFKTPALD